jgi:ribonucleotide reductase beta subunit family protein with ferritin-like domain
MQEEILSDTINRFSVFPIKHDNIWKRYKTAVSAFWQVEEVDLSKDIDDWNNKLNTNERTFIKNILGFFAQSDGIVNENLVLRFYNDVKIPEARSYYAFQIAIESVHSEMYALMIDTFVKNTQEKNALFDAINTIPCVARKANWALKWIQDKEASFGLRLLAFAVVEGLYFSASFCSISWLKDRNVMPGLCMSNDFIQRDENGHYEMACELYSMLNNKLDEQVVYDLIKEATDIEIEFITESIPCNLIGMNQDLMVEYIKYVADRVSVQFGYNKIYSATNPFPFMEKFSLENKVNFFEQRPTQYTKAKVGQQDVYKFKIDEEF